MTSRAQRARATAWARAAQQRVRRQGRSARGGRWTFRLVPLGAIAIAVAAAVIAVFGGTGAAAAKTAGSGAKAGTGNGLTASAAAAAKPKRGGTITIGGNSYSVLDPGNAAYSAAVNSQMANVFGTLFTPGSSPTTFDPGLAQTATYNKTNTQLIIKLRKGLKFQDGTPLNAKAMLWNFQRYSQPTSSLSQYFSLVKSMKTTGDLSLKITFKQPYTLLVAALADTAAGFMGSPTAYKKMGATTFGTQPVGAGPFKITAVNPGQQLTMTRASTYYDASHVYLNSIIWKNTGVDDSTELTDLQSNAIQELPLTGALSSGAVIKQAQADTSLAAASTANTYYVILPINTTAPPFNNQKAREALAYCTDRAAIAKDVTEGTTEPAYVLSGSDSAYLSSSAAGQKLNPYSYNPAKGKALVKQLGGLSFTFRNSYIQDIPTALQQDWEQCGMKVNLTTVAPAQIVAGEASGSYQIDITVVPNPSLNPGLYTTYQTPTTPVDSHGFNDPTVTKLIHQANGISDVTQGAKVWAKIWTRVNTDAVSIPVVSMGTDVFSNKCLQGMGLQPALGGPTFTNAYLTCSV
jgi:peptide/nickel transport system substrate-binding protein